MNSDQFYIGIDSGTQGTKAVIVSREQKAIIAEGYTPHALVESDSGRREQDPDQWVGALDAALEMALEAAGIDRSGVRGIGVSGQQHGFVPMDRNGNVIRPAKLWCDTETTRQAEDIIQRMGGGGRLIQTLGIQWQWDLRHRRSSGSRKPNLRTMTVCTRSFFHMIISITG